LELEAKTPLYTHYTETLNDLITLRAAGWIEQAYTAGGKLLYESQKPLYFLYMVQRWLNFVLDMSFAVLAVLVTTIAVTQRLEQGLTGVALTQVMSMGVMIQNVILAWTKVETSAGAIKRIQEFSERTPVENHASHDKQSLLPLSWPSEGRLEFKNVTATYHESNDTPVLQGLNLNITPGEKVVVCGRSGR